jgi:hypothetical protein
MNNSLLLRNRKKMISTIVKIVSGGQTGVDRAALDVAIDRGLDYGGWCPQGGWAEDRSTPPGVLLQYPKMAETPSTNPAQRTEWNVRDSSATLILVDDRGWQLSAGTKLTYDVAIRLDKPVSIVNVYEENGLASIREWVSHLDKKIILNVAGARESECPGIYLATKKIIEQILQPYS